MKQNSSWDADSRYITHAFSRLCLKCQGLLPCWENLITLTFSTPKFISISHALYFTNILNQLAVELHGKCSNSAGRCLAQCCYLQGPPGERWFVAESVQTLTGLHLVRTMVVRSAAFVFQRVGTQIVIVERYVPWSAPFRVCSQKKGSHDALLSAWGQKMPLKKARYRKLRQ